MQKADLSLYISLAIDSASNGPVVSLLQFTHFADNIPLHLADDLPASRGRDVFNRFSPGLGAAPANKDTINSAGCFLYNVWFSPWQLPRPGSLPRIRNVRRPEGLVMKKFLA